MSCGTYLYHQEFITLSVQFQRNFYYVLYDVGNQLSLHQVVYNT